MAAARPPQQGEAIPGLRYSHLRHLSARVRREQKAIPPTAPGGADLGVGTVAAAGRPADSPEDVDDVAHR